jgi:hypothetical protein
VAGAIGARRKACIFAEIEAGMFRPRRIDERSVFEQRERPFMIDNGFGQFFEVTSGVESLEDDLGQQTLIVAEGLVPVDPGEAGVAENRADVLVLSLDRSMAAAVQEVAEEAVVFSLVVRLSAQLALQHREVVRYRGLDLFAAPVLSHRMRSVDHLHG